MLTRSMSAATNGSKGPFATMGSMVPRKWQSASQPPGRLMPPLGHAQGLAAKDDLMLVHELLGVSRAQEFVHLNGSQSAILLALPAHPREPASGPWERVS